MVKKFEERRSRKRQEKVQNCPTMLLDANGEENG